jgi:hypothetical protein
MSNLQKKGRWDKDSLPLMGWRQLTLGQGIDHDISKKLEPNFKILLMSLLKEYADCFMWEYREMSGLSRSIMEHQLPIKPGFRLFPEAPCNFNPKTLEEIKEEIEKMTAAGFIRTCRYATWIFSIMPVWRKNGKLRICIDFRDLNKTIPKDEYPMPMADMLINVAVDHKMMSFLDGNAGYNQIFMVEEDVYMTAFRCPGSIGLFEWIMMTFSLKNA